MSEDALNTAIAAKWESAGLNAGDDDTEVLENGGEEDVVDVDDSIPDPAEPSGEEGASGDTSDDPPAEADAAETDPPVEKAAVETETKAEELQHDAEDELATALGLGKPPEDPKKRAQWWKTRVPYSQLHKVVTEREKKLNDTHTGVLKERDTKITEYDTRFSDVKKVEDIITNNPEQYIKTLAALFPDTYGKTFAPLLAKPAAPVPEVVDPGPMPEPDYSLPDGSKTYSLAGLQKRLEWDQKVSEQKILERFKPHLEFVQQQQTEAEKQKKIHTAEEIQKQGEKSANEAIAEAETWDLGKENIKEIVEVAKKLDSRYDAVTALNIAYRQVVVPKLKAKRDEMHAEILKGMKKTSAKQTAAALTQTRSVPAVVDPASTDLDTRIKAAWKRKGLI